MKGKHKSYLLVNLARASTLLVLMRAWLAAAQDSPVTSPLVKQMYGGGWPDIDELKSVHEQFLLQHAVLSYMITLPTLNIIGKRDGSEAEFSEMEKRSFMIQNLTWDSGRSLG